MLFRSERTRRMFSFPRASSSDPLDDVLFRALILPGDEDFFCACVESSSIGTTGGAVRANTSFVSALDGVPGSDVISDVCDPRLAR